jgi:DNA-damage-inducible protein J
MTTTINARIDSEVKEQATKILDCLGLPMSTAISLFLRQVVIQHRIPFDIEIPNELTAKVLADSKKGKGVHEAANVNELFKELNT